MWGYGEVLGKVWQSALGVGEVRGKVCGGGGKVLGEVWESVLGCGESKERWEIQGGVGKCWVRCGKVCWGVGKVRKRRGSMGKCWRKAWESMLGCEGGVGKCVGMWGR